jgi:hypothetical protein
VYDEGEGHACGGQARVRGRGQPDSSTSLPNGKRHDSDAPKREDRGQKRTASFGSSSGARAFGIFEAEVIAV